MKIVVIGGTGLIGSKVVDILKGRGHETIAAAPNTGVNTITGEGLDAALAVVGTDRLQASGYFRAKQAQESLIKTSPIPYTLLHATQFFEFLRSIAQSGSSAGDVRLPHALFQPMAAQDVAAAVAEAAQAAPVNGMIEIAGPKPFPIDELVGRVLAFDKDPRRIVADPGALYFGVKVDDRSLMPGPKAQLGSTSFDWWLTHVPPPPNK